MINRTELKIPKQYQKYICEVWEQNGYNASLIECCICRDTKTQEVCGKTAEQFLENLKTIEIMSEEEYKREYGDIAFDDYKKDLEKLISTK